MTWNWRGSSRIATNDNSVIAMRVASGGSRVRMAAVAGRSIACENSAVGPSNIQNVTNTPTARKATSLTINSAAIASISPS